LAPNGAFATGGGALGRGSGVASGRASLGMVGPGAVGPSGAVAPSGRINHWSGAGAGRYGYWNGGGWRGRGHHVHAGHRRFGLGFGWGYGNDTYCRRWTPAGYVWVCRYPYY
jgi:hypothetical protein